MKVLQPNQTDPIICDDECGDGNAAIVSNHQKSNNIQDLLNAHNVTNKSECEPPKVRFAGISEILSSLYLCGAGVAIPIFFEKLGITCVINAAPELPDTPLSLIDDAKPLYLQIPVLDKSDINISVYFDEVADLIEQVRQRNGKTMVHCLAGVSRSASLCLAYLMKHMKMSLKDAFELVRSVRPQIRPNTGFIRQLIAYEEKLYQNVSVRMIYKESLEQEIPDIYEPEYQALELFYQKHRNLKLR